MELYDQVQKVLDRVQAEFQYEPDQRQWGQLEHWHLPPDLDAVVGDCDDHAIACRALLREQGIEARLVVCLAEDGGGHLVCAVGDYILDNRFPSVQRKAGLERLGYQWLMISGTEPGDDWHRLEDRQHGPE